MIYVLFGPPGVGKTYLGHLLSKELECAFFDADTIINENEITLLREGKYTQKDRDKYVSRLTRVVRTLYDYVNRDLILAEAFPKIKNRKSFIDSFETNVKFINVWCPMEVAKKRLGKRISDHVINKKAFDLIWREFESERGDYPIITNNANSDTDLIVEFDKIRKEVEE